MSRVFISSDGTRHILTTKLFVAKTECGLDLEGLTVKTVDKWTPFYPYDFDCKACINEYNRFFSRVHDLPAIPEYV